MRAAGARSLVASVTVLSLVVALAGPAAAATPAPAAKPIPADPWPREVTIPGATVLVYQPQVSSWEGNQLDFRAAIAVKPAGSTAETFGVVWATARTQVDRVSRIVALDAITLTKANFPTVPDGGAAYLRELQKALTPAKRTIALDRLEASLAASGTMKPAGIPVDNAPPRIIVSESPAILVPIDGAPVVRAIPGTTFERVINTRALVVRPQGMSTYYLHVYDGWLYAGAVTGPWYSPTVIPPAIDPIAQQLAHSGQVDLLTGGNATPRPSLSTLVPVIYVSETPTELIVFQGAPRFTPIAGTALAWGSNTAADVILDGATYYALVSGRWYRAPTLGGPWAYVPSPALPADFRRIPPASPAGVVLASIAGTPQAQEAVIANSIPQTATVPRVNGPTFTAVIDGAPQYRVIEGTQIQYVVNSASPILFIWPNAYYALRAGVWFSSTSIAGPWYVAAYVPPAIYAIPPTSPLHYVTYVRVYGSTAQVVYVGYTPGYLGTVVTPDGVVVYGTGYVYQPWVGTVWYPPPATYGVMAQPVYNPAAGMAFGFAMGVTTAAIAGAYYHPAYYGYPCCGSTSVNVYGHYGNTSWSGTRTYYTSSSGQVGETSSGTYTNARTGTTGSYSAQKSVAPGSASRSYDRSFNTTGGTTGSVSRGETYEASTGRYNYDSSVSATGPKGTSVDSTRQSTVTPYGQAGTERQTTVTNPNTGVTRTTDAAAGVGPDGAAAGRQTTYTNTNTGNTATVDRGAGADSQGSARGGQVTTTNASTGQTKTYGAGRANNTVYANDNGDVYRNNGSGWQQHTSNGWQNATGDTSWADREQQARSTGQSRFDSFSQSGGGLGSSGSGGWGSRFSGGSGGGGWGDRFGEAGGGGWGDRFGGGGGWGGRFGGRR